MISRILKYRQLLDLPIVPVIFNTLIKKCVYYSTHIFVFFKCLASNKLCNSDYSILCIQIKKFLREDLGIHPTSLWFIQRSKQLNEWQSCRPNVSAGNSEDKALPQGRLEPYLQAYATLPDRSPFLHIIIQTMQERKRKRR